jgi:1-acyl-sn-glycerol-3-phosphate acyltransferase
VDEPAIYILFPEGTRSRDGAMGSFKQGIGMLVASSDIPVVPCYLEGAHRAFPPHAKWPRPAPLKLRIGTPLRFPATPNERAGWRDVSEVLEAAVRALRPDSGNSGFPASAQDGLRRGERDSGN